MNYQKILNEIESTINSNKFEGEVASYIPELSKVEPSKFGMHLISMDNQQFYIGDSQERLSIQSISKVLTLVMAFNEVGDDLWERVDVEPSGDPFNSLVQLEYENGIPRNPLINAGAIVVSDILLSLFEDPKTELLYFARKLSGNPEICFDEGIVRSEKIHGFRNTSLVYLMKSFGNIKNDPEAVLDFYYHHCSLAMNCQELARTFMVFANQGKILNTGERILSPSYTKRINAIMHTCGFYDEAGEFSFRVGLPGKSGVGGGIVAIHPSQYSVAVWSPMLNPKGNSTKGMLALELLTTKTGLSIF